MPRSLWNGTIACGAVAVPVKLYSAVETQTVHFHEVHLQDDARIEHRPFCAKEDKEVPRDEVVKGDELASGRYVVLDKEEIEAAGRLALADHRRRALRVRRRHRPGVLREVLLLGCSRRRSRRLPPYADEHRERLLAVIEDKKKQRTIEAPEQDDEPQAPTDLMAALRKTMEDLGAKRG